MLVWYILIALLATWISRIEKKFTVGVCSAYIALPYACFTAIGVTAFMFVTFKMTLLLVVVVCLVLTKLKVFIGVKIAAICASLGAAALGIALGPIGWIVLAVFVIVFFVVVLYAIGGAYTWAFSKLALAVMRIRRTADSLRAQIPSRMGAFVTAIEVAIVCFWPAYSVWQLMDWADGSRETTISLTVLRCVCLVPFVSVTFLSYRRDTSPPNAGGEGMDIPALVQTSDVVEGLGLG